MSPITTARVVEMLIEAGAKGPLAPNWVSYLSEFLSSGRVGQASPERRGRWTARERSAQKAMDELRCEVTKLAAAYRSAASAAEDPGGVYDNGATFSCGNAEALTDAAAKMVEWIENAPTFHPKDRKQTYLDEVVVALDAMVQRAVEKECKKTVSVRFIIMALTACGTRGSFTERAIGSRIKRPRVT